MKKRLFAAVNIMSLSIALCFAILVFLYVSDELSYDSFHEDADNIFRVTISDSYHNRVFNGIPVTTGPALVENFPEIESTVRITEELAVVSRDENMFREYITFTDNSFFDFFSFPLLLGDPGNCLSEDNFIVLSASAALKYFGEDNPLGKSVSIILGNQKIEFTVTGIAENAPENSSIFFNILIHLNNLDLIRGKSYVTSSKWFNMPTYVKIVETIGISHIKSKLPVFAKQDLAGHLEERRINGRWDGIGEPLKYNLLNVRDLHLNSTVFGSSDIKSSYILSAIALLVLFIASINYTNLTIGNSSIRSLEIGIRKVVGAERKQIIKQFWSESFALTSISLTLGFFLAIVLLPVFNELSGKGLSYSNILSWPLLLFTLFLTLFVSLAGGSYPAIVMSGFSPVKSLSGRSRIGGKNLLTRSLITAQFFLSIVMIVASIVITRQIKYVNSTYLGYEKKGVVIINTQKNGYGESRRFLELYGNRIKDSNSVIDVSGSSSSFNRRITMAMSEAGGKKVPVYMHNVSYDYIKTTGMELIDGRGFSRDMYADSLCIVVNRAFTDEFGLGSPVGQTVRIGLQPPLKIIGVVENYNFVSLQNRIGPAAFGMLPDFSIHYIIVRISGNNISKTIEFLKNRWKELSPDKPFIYSFLEDDLALQYINEERWNSIIRYTSIFVIFISCLGILGMTSITIDRKIKEIGIRKVLGASVPGIIVLLSGDFFKWILAANILAIPASYFLMNNWLQNYAYRTEMNIWIFAAACLITALTAGISIFILTVKAASTNPVKSLRYE